MKELSEQVRRVSVLRTELLKRNLSGFLIPHADEYQNEYTPDSAERLQWLTGFTGSAGIAVAMQDTGAIFVDGRYVLQVKTEVHPSCFEPYHSAEMSVTEWLSSVLQPGSKLGYDPWLHTSDEVERLRAVCEQSQAELVTSIPNPVDVVWTDRPTVPLTAMIPHPLHFAGKDSREKREELCKKLREDRIGATVITSPDSLAWLLNIRGNDLSYTPLSLCMGILYDDGLVRLFVQEQKLTPQILDHLGATVFPCSLDTFEHELEQLGQQRIRVLCDSKKTPSWILDRLKQYDARVVHGDDLCALPKACKNMVEIQGARNAHIRDGVALCRFLAWLNRESLSGKVTELDAAKYLDTCRQQSDLWQDMSFPTISGAGANGAIIHYRSTPESNARLDSGTLYLVDSGAQYLDGTTDVTRTVAIGTPTAEHRDRYTRVLKGHIALATARFPKGTTGSQLDVLARTSLWEAGLDYDHGTGHGVGSYLGVHEGPQRISKAGGSIALHPGMIVSNEPGYYKAGAYGIRIESLVLVIPCADVVGAERELYAFETLTLAPFDRSLIERTLLHDEEIAWINAYHARVFEVVCSIVDDETVAWLRDATNPL
ncbi:MAG: Xaa-Pro aminopeptidase [Nitrospirales bacterium]|nr:MAG: Xaa-Pro aminopeptidase [Nitrospirales bacterium]